MNLVDASYSARNSAPLAQAVRNVNRIRYLIPLAKYLRLLDLPGCEFVSKSLNEIGRMTGGSWKSSRRTASWRNLTE